MAVLETTILLIILVILSNIISHYLVAVPTALIEIAVGVIAALFLHLDIELQTDWFMLLFVAPLLYNDAKHFPKKELWELRAPIFANAIFLVFLTTIAGGLLINLFIPQVSLPLAFALAAVLSPTDPVAVQGIAEQVKLPKRILTLISGESLINDASGLIAFKYALAAFLTGTFSLRQASGDFIYMTLIGTLTGYIISRLIYLIQRSLLRQGIQDVILHSSLQVMTPFVIFIMAEIVRASGVIAVVVSGVMAIQQEPLFRGQFSEIKIVTNKLWDIIIYLLNGIVFVVLGTTLPYAMRGAIINPTINNALLILYVIIVWLILMIIRTLWTYAYMWYHYFKAKDNIQLKPKFSIAILTGLTGVRGAVTMAMVLSIPFFLPNGAVFQERYLIIFLASGVILASLLVAVITLPIFTKQKKRLILAGDEGTQEPIDDSNNSSQLPEIEARKLMTKRAIQSLQQELNNENQLIINDILQDFDKQLRFLYLDDNHTSNTVYYELESDYRCQAADFETNKVMEILPQLALPKKIEQNYLKMLEYKQRAHSSNVKIIVQRSLYKVQKKIKRIVYQTFLKRQPEKSQLDNVKKITLLEVKSSEATLDMLNDCQNNLDKADKYFTVKYNILNQLMMEYTSKIHRIQHYHLIQESSYQEIYRDYFLRALDEERGMIQKLLEQGRISNTMANQLRQGINYNETSFLQTNIED